MQACASLSAGAQRVTRIREAAATSPTRGQTSLGESTRIQIRSATIIGFNSSTPSVERHTKTK